MKKDVCADIEKETEKKKTVGKWLTERKRGNANTQKKGVKAHDGKTV